MIVAYSGTLSLICTFLLTVVTNDRRVLRNAFSNVYRWHYFLWNHDGDNQELKWFTYTKHNDWTALRLTSSGDHRSIYQSGYDRCTRW